MLAWEWGSSGFFSRAYGFSATGISLNVQCQVRVPSRWAGHKLSRQQLATPKTQVPHLHLLE